MKIGYWDAFSGISGDMAVGSLVDAGVEFEALVAGLDSLGTGARFRWERTRRRGVSAGKFSVDYQAQHKHRHLPQILDMIAGSSLPPRAKQNAAQVFEKLAAAEAKVHGIPIEKVHFHEVGATDSICDIAGACLALDLLGIEEMYCSPVNLGSGTVRSEHGVLPVPAPATAELLAAKPVYSSGPALELTTPTGAALAATLVKAFGPMPAMRLSGSGYGAGDRDLPDRPNVLRLLIGETSQAEEATLITVIEANIDDCSPQVLGYAMEKLLAAGALDVSITPLLMKKNRPGSLLRVLARIEDQERLAAVVFEETSTLGLRLYRAERRVEPRQLVEVDTRFGRVRVKASPGGAFAPEYEDCRALAEKARVPLKEVIAEANHAYLQNKK